MCVKGKVKSVVSFDSVFTVEDKAYEKSDLQPISAAYLQG